MLHLALADIITVRVMKLEAPSFEAAVVFPKHYIGR
jgi:hypothetical protein